MGMIACYIMVDDDVIEEFATKDSEELFECLEEMMDEADKEASLDIDKMWDGIHFLLTGVSASEPIEADPLSEAIVGESLFHDEEDADFIAYTYSGRVKCIAERLAAVDVSQVLEAFQPKLLARQGIYPNIWMHEEAEDLRKELEATLLAIKDFYEKACELQKGVIVSIY